MKVATWNVNGIRARASQLREWLEPRQKSWRTTALALAGSLLAALVSWGAAKVDQPSLSQ